MTFPVFASGDILGASDMNAVGLWRVTSTTFTGQSTVSVNNCFSADYSNYVITASLRGSAVSFARWRLRVSGSDASGNDYFRAGFSTGVGVGTVNAYNGGPETSWIPFAEYGSATTGFGYTQILLNNPFATTSTGAFTQVNNTNAASMYNQALTHVLVTSYTGFSVIPNTGTITGTITVYGVKP